MFKKVVPQVNFSSMEDELTRFWKENKIFEKSVENRPDDKRWTFLDGPPFVTGMPHYGSLLSSLPKDLFGRYWTMKGYRVRRVWGWDGHGLPIENKVEGKLKIKRKRDIEEIVGVEKFINECKAYVEEVSGEWEWYIDKIGRWVDFKNAYKTWDISYMESVMWVFSQMYKKGHIYKGLRVSLYCPHCSTPISNFEVAMDADNYKQITDAATTYKYKLIDQENTFILAWSTTPWNKIVTLALAVNPKFTYVKVKQGSEYYILAESTLKMLKADIPYEIIEKISGKDLIGRKYEPHYDYFPIDEGKQAFVIIGGDFVTAEEGTGVVTIAVYGEEDLKAMEENNIHIQTHVDDEGVILPEVPKFGGLYYLDSNEKVNEDLSERGLIYEDKPLPHNVPHCWRCATRLYYAPQNAWFVNVKDLKEKLFKTNENVNWFPSHFKNGRFLKSLESAPDWNISRSRYWGSPVPVWECECGERFVPDSIKELEQESGVEINDLHKPAIDKVIIKCKKCDRNVKRVQEVLDSWIEAGSASFAERHFPFNTSESLENFYPPDFIAEYTGQIRAWFYVLHVIGVALYDSQAFKNVVVEGVILGTDGRKMSKNYGNFPDPKKLIEMYGGDALRMYLLGSPVMNGEDIRISEIDYRDQVKGTLLILWNVYNFFVSYAQSDNWEPKEDDLKNEIIENKENVLDRWIVSKLNGLIISITDSLDSYDTVNAVSSFKKFVDELSTWYLRRSRDRVGASSEDENDRDAFYSTCFQVLVVLSKLIAPITPFISEEIFRNLTGKESVHLQNWPSKMGIVDKELENQMVQAQQLASTANAFRKEAGIKVKIPFVELHYKGPIELDEEVLKIVREEVNIQTFTYAGSSHEFVIEGSTDESNQNLKAGEARDIIRNIQKKRKELGTSLNQKVVVKIQSVPQGFEKEIKRKALVSEFVISEEFEVEVI